MELNASDKREIVLRYVKELKYRAIDISKATGISFFTINQMLECDQWIPEIPVLDQVLHFLETGKAERRKHVFCNGSGCEALRAFITEKDHLIQIPDDTIKLLRAEIETLKRGAANV